MRCVRLTLTLTFIGEFEFHSKSYPLEIDDKRAVLLDLRSYLQRFLRPFMLRIRIFESFVLGTILRKEKKKEHSALFS